MANDLVSLEQDLTPLMPRFTQALAGRMPADRLVRTMLISVEKTPKLLECTRRSLFNAAMSAAVLGLEVDGVTGQAFLIPFGNYAQLVIGYKGLTTIGARSGYTITAGTVREGDAFDYELGSGAFVRHKPKLGNQGRVIAAWSVASSKVLPAVPMVLSIDEVNAIKARSQGAKKKESPWNDPIVGFLAMAEKSARRRLSRSMPLNVETRDYHYAAALEEAHEERGRLAHITPDKGVIIEGEVVESPIPDREPASETPPAAQLTMPIENADPTIKAAMEVGVAKAKEGSRELQKWWDKTPTPIARNIAKFYRETLVPMAEKADTGSLE